MRQGLKKTLKVTLITLASAVGLCLVAVAVVLWLVLTPSRLTPIVEEAANRYLNAEVRIGKVDVTLLSTFPRLTLRVEDGEMVGDNRVTDDFQMEFDDFLQSSDIFLGREMDWTTFGNSGFRVYIYENGLIGLLLVILLYIFAYSHAKDKRVWIAAMTIATLCFIVRGYPLWYNYFIPLLCTASLDTFSGAKNSRE